MEGKKERGGEIEGRRKGPSPQRKNPGVATALAGNY